MSRITKVISVLLIAFILLLSNVQTTLASIEEGDFNDIKPSDWFYNDVREARKLGLVAGTGNNMYTPQKAISYAEYITILARILGIEGKSPVQGKHWASGNIEAAIRLGIIQTDELKNVDAGIPREVMVRYQPADGSEVIFEDTRIISPDVRAYINAAYKEYLTEGVGRDSQGRLLFGYGQTVDRAQLATMALRIKAYKENKEAYKQERAIARQAAEAQWRQQHSSGSSGGSGSSQQTEYVMWNGYKFPKGSVFYRMNKDSNPSEVDFGAAVRFIKYPQEYDELYNTLTSKLDANTVKQAIDYAKTKTNVEQVLQRKTFRTPNGYEIDVYSVYGAFTVSFEIYAPGK